MNLFVEQIANELQELNSQLLTSFIDILNITKQPEYYFYDLIKKHENRQSNHNNKHSETKPNVGINDTDNDKILKHEDVVRKSPMMNTPLMYEPSQLTPVIVDKCESLKIIFRDMRDILNSLRPHQAKQTLIQTLQKQIIFKQNKLKAIKQNIIDGEKFVNQELNVKKEKENGSDGEDDAFFNASTDNNHTQESIKKLKQMLDDEFFE